MTELDRRSWMLLVGAGSAAAMVGCHGTANAKPDVNGDTTVEVCSNTTELVAVSCASGDPATQICDNHPHALHVLIVTADQVRAGVDVTYDLKGAANHDHQITITAAQFSMLQAGGTINLVTDTSTTATIAGNDHDHVCAIVCG